MAIEFVSPVVWPDTTTVSEEDESAVPGNLAEALDFILLLFLKNDDFGFVRDRLVELDFETHHLPRKP